MNTPFFLTFKKLFVLCLGILFATSIFAEPSIQQGNVAMMREDCAIGDQYIHSCRLIFKDLRYEGQPQAYLYDDLGGIGARNNLSDSFDLLRHSRSLEPIAGNGNGKPEFSLDNTGIMENLSYNSDEVEDRNTTTFERESDLLPSGYYAVKDASGLYWSAYLEYLPSSYGGLDLDMRWGAVNDPAHPSQACSPSDSFSRTTGCGNGGGTVTPPPTTGNNASVFDGAGSLIAPNMDCFGCDKDSANMQPHNNATSTVVFQWLYDAQQCSRLNLVASEPIDVVVKSKGWSDSTIQSAFEAQLGNGSFPRLDAQGEWTTFSVTSLNPINNAVTIHASCMSSSNISVDGIVYPTQTTPVNLAGSGNWSTTWMGSGSLITDAVRTGANDDTFGLTQDIAIASTATNALTSFQWYASQSCTSISIGDRNNFNTPLDAIVSIKEWNGSSFQTICNSLPCDTPNGVPETYYVLKIESSAGTFPSGQIQSVCR